MPRWLPKVLTRIRELAVARRVRFTLKACRELALLAGGLDEEDACDALAKLTALSEVTGEWMYLFKPMLAAARLYVKVILRSDCIVVSFHEDEGEGHEEDA
jgi:hypothetical protein